MRIDWGDAIGIIGCGYSEIERKPLTGTVELHTRVKRTCDNCPYTPESVGCRFLRSRENLKVVYLFPSGVMKTGNVKEVCIG